jgi:hypothetical protein
MNVIRKPFHENILSYEASDIRSSSPVLQITKQINTHFQNQEFTYGWLKLKQDVAENLDSFNMHY